MCECSWAACKSGGILTFSFMLWKKVVVLQKYKFRLCLVYTASVHCFMSQLAHFT